MSTLAQEYFWLIQTSTPPLPPPPTRQQAITIVTSGMQGTVVQTQQFGLLPWWDAALPWLTNPQDRQAVYAAKRAQKDTHCLMQLPWGPPLYDEPNQAYSPDRFGPLDWTAVGDQRLPQLVLEVIRSGFIPVVFLGGDNGEAGYPIAVKQLQMLCDKLGSLMDYTVVCPGWDGIFYGWTIPHLEEFARLFRQLWPNGFLVMEFGAGHIPQEAGADMSGYDALLVEFDRSVHDCNNWQIIPRLIGEAAYKRPSDDNWRLCSTTPPPYPRMPMSTPRGEIQTVAFEWKTYWWVRWENTAEEIEQDRAYLIAEGCPAVC